MAKLVLFAQDSAQDIFLHKERITLGRRADNDVCMPHPAVSGEHAAVVTILSDSFLEDLGSTNGTLVNGKPVLKHFLRDGDIVDVGRQFLIYVVDETARPTLPPQMQPRSESSSADSVRDDFATTDTQHSNAAITLGGNGNSRDEHAGRHVRTGVDAHAFAFAPHRVGGEMSQATQPPELVVLTGPNAGRTLALTKDVTSVGRTGVQMALIRRTAQGFLAVAGEGSRPPLLNGTTLDPGGSILGPGDVLEVAGARIEFSAAPDLPT